MRLAAAMGFSVILLAMFGWQSATRTDEWAVAACNLAMGTTLLLGGPSAFSLDNVPPRRRPALADGAWFRWASGNLPPPLADIPLRNLTLILFTFVGVCNVAP